MAEEHLHPREVASRLGVQPRDVRAFLRRQYPRGEQSLGNRWHLDPTQVEEVEEHFKRRER